MAVYLFKMAATMLGFSRNPVQQMGHSVFLGQFPQTESKLAVYRYADIKHVHVDPGHLATHKTDSN